MSRGFEAMSFFWASWHTAACCCSVLQRAAAAAACSGPRRPERAAKSYGATHVCIVADAREARNKKQEICQLVASSHRTVENGGVKMARLFHRETTRKDNVTSTFQPTKDVAEVLGLAPE